MDKTEQVTGFCERNSVQMCEEEADWDAHTEKPKSRHGEVCACVVALERAVGQHDTESNAEPEGVERKRSDLKDGVDAIASNRSCVAKMQPVPPLMGMRNGLVVYWALST